MPRYSHQLGLGFTVESDNEDGNDITPEMIRRALLERMKDLVGDEALEACLPPMDTDEIEE